jgi:hypothetical protein
MDIILVGFALFGKTKSPPFGPDGLLQIFKRPLPDDQYDGPDRLSGKKLDTSGYFSLYTLSYLPVQSGTPKLRFIRGPPAAARWRDSFSTTPSLPGGLEIPNPFAVPGKKSLL